MLYLKKFENFKIILRGVPVVQFNIADEFRYPETIMYKPQAAAMEYVIQTNTLPLFTCAFTCECLDRESQSL